MFNMNFSDDWIRTAVLGKGNDRSANCEATTALYLYFTLSSVCDNVFGENFHCTLYFTIFILQDDDRIMSKTG